jgi:hypothetical protein
MIRKPASTRNLGADATLGWRARNTVLGTSAARPTSLSSERPIGNQATLRVQREPSAGRSGPAKRAAIWDFSSVPNHAPERNSVAVRPLARARSAPPTVQSKLEIGAVDDPLEAEADRVAERVMHTSEPRSQLDCTCGGGGCPECHAKQSPQVGERVLARHADTGDRGPTVASPLIDEVLSAPGKPLDTSARAFMEPRFGYDFSRVRVHLDESAARSARDIGANAYTVGNHIVFNVGQFDPSPRAGGRLLAHELTHVVQQNAAGRPELQRDNDKTKDKPAADKPKPATAAADKAASQQAAPAKPEPGTAYFHIVVRDRGLDLGGGVLVSDLEGAKTKLMTRKVDKPWTLVLSIHASENRLGAQSPPDWQKDAKFYDDADVKRIFGGDSAFVQWRDNFGPNRVVLYGCQVTAAFEQTITNNLARGGQAPSAAGLGEGCKPLATVVTFGVNSRREYEGLAESEKTKVLGQVQAANSTWGYYGGPPVPNDEVIDYLFKGPKPGSWAQVEVVVKQGNDFVSTKPPIPYWNRLSNSMYLRQCTKAVGNLREHTPVAPP